MARFASSLSRRTLCARPGFLGLGFLVAVSVAGLAARESWVAEALVNFRWQLGLGGLVASILLATGGRFVFAAVALAISSAHLGPAAMLYVGRPSPPAGAVSVRVASLNLNYENRASDRLRAWLRGDRFDLVAFLEVGSFWKSEIESLRADFPNEVIAPFDDSKDPSCCGLALLSRLPLEGVRIHSGDWGIRPVIECAAKVGSEALHVVVAHPNRLGDAERTRSHNDTLRWLGEGIVWTDRSILLGDLNATLYSPEFGDLLERSRLRDSRQGFGRLPTFDFDRYVDGMWLDLDHILVGRSVVVADRAVGPAVGSDHLPVTATLCVAPSSSTPK
ncbi:MAG TPA: endonuclease/exonuclease/phosphatase family protein [Planctomycetota bacterium]|nr:endonuclease/exonuclease/phosphatase family protein [Planctomycetota bacterium]